MRLDFRRSPPNVLSFHLTVFSSLSGSRKDLCKVVDPERQSDRIAIPSPHWEIKGLADQRSLVEKALASQTNGNLNLDSHRTYLYRVRPISSYPDPNFLLYEVKQVILT